MPAATVIDCTRWTLAPAQRLSDLLGISDFAPQKCISTHAERQTTVFGIQSERANPIARHISQQILNKMPLRSKASSRHFEQNCVLMHFCGKIKEISSKLRAGRH
jgi:hypothetical protein